MKHETMNMPKLPCELCLANPDRTQWRKGEFMVTHCSHDQAGGIFVAQKNFWIILTPIDEDTFARVAAVQISGILTAVESS